MNTSLFRHAFVLILLSLVGGLFVPAMAIPRLGLSAHTIGILSGVLLIAVGTIWEQFRLSSAQAAWHGGLWVYSSYANWLACVVGAVTGAGRMTPVAAGGLQGPSAAEAIVFALLASVVVTSFGAVGLALWGLRGERPA